jgi:hypothetical protein
MSNPQITVQPRRVTLTANRGGTTVIQVGKPGPAGPPGDATFQSAEVDSACQPGQPLYLKPNGHLDLAKADGFATARVCGLAIEVGTPTVSVDYTPDGVIALPDWSAVTGTASLLPGADYFLSPDTAGKLTTIAPTTSGQLVVALGRALSVQKLEIEIQPLILL